MHHRHLFHTWATLTNKTPWPMNETSACDMHAKFKVAVRYTAIAVNNGV